ncbi:MAG TPA: DHH family phosphoesterase [Patescibacteria group bacterium]
MTPIIITDNENPDLDGTACIYAYTEFLKTQGESPLGAIYGTPQREALFVLDCFKVSPLPIADQLVTPQSQVILVDTSVLRTIAAEQINPTQVIEIIDHRQFNHAESFPSAKVQIERVGAAATLIAEKFQAVKIKPTYESAGLLYSAIISNTVNFKNNVTTDRDRAMATWLKAGLNLPEDYIDQMFTAKSKLNGTLEEVIRSDVALNELGGKRFGIAQQEIVQAKNFIEDNKDELHRILQTIKKEKLLDHIFLSCIDVLEGKNYFFFIDPETEALTTRIYNQHGHPIMMRKEIFPAIKQAVEKDPAKQNQA